MAGSVPMNTALFKSEYTPVLIANYLLGLKALSTQWDKYVKVVASKKLQIEQNSTMYGLQIAEEIPQGDPIPYQGGGESYKTQFIKKKYGVAFAVTEEAMEYDEFFDIQAEFAPELPRAMNEAKELVAANILNYAFTDSAAYLGGDGEPLISSAHPIQGGTFSNVLATPSDISEAAIEQLTIQIMNAVDETNRPMELNPVQLLHSNSDVYVVERILKSALRVATANNDINALKNMGVIARTQPVRRLTDQDAWFIQTDAKKGIELMYGWRARTRYEGDFDTGNMRGKCTEAYAINWTDPRCLYGSAGV